MSREGSVLYSLGPSGDKRQWGRVTYQLSYVLLNGVRIDKHGDCNQGIQSEIEDLVTEERDDPGSVLLNTRKRMLMRSI